MPNKATAEVRTLAREHAPAAIEELSRLAKEAQSEQARISACTALLDRAYGKSQIGQPIKIELPDTSTIDGLARSLTAILNATASGRRTPAEAQSLSGVIETRRLAIETAVLEDRIERLEQAAARPGE